MSTYNFSSVDPAHYNRIRATIPNHLAIRTVNICVSTLTTNCNIEVMNEQDYIEFTLDEKKHKVFMERRSKITSAELPQILQNILNNNDLSDITVRLTDIDTIEFFCDESTIDRHFTITDMSYNMKLLCGFYCLDDSQWPIKSINTKVEMEPEELKDKNLSSISFPSILPVIFQV